MALMLSSFAAVICTAIWYTKAHARKLYVGTLLYMYWGVTLMWLVDAIAEYLEIGAEYFTPEPMDMLHDAFLGFSTIALGLIIWAVILLVKDPDHVIRSAAADKKLGETA